ncbi:multidrug transporter [Rhizomicrobium sp. SCGC AG-212-E05]|nr:multidrug transporter [Rhizomicrobium sp. SCGC AG-212-E05]
MRTFYHVASNTLLTTLANFFLWFALVFWVYLETRSLLASSIIAGAYMLIATVSSFWFGGIVDHHRKKSAMLFSSLATLVFFAGACLIYLAAPDGTFKNASSLWLWSFVCAVLVGVIMSNIRTIALPITVTILVPEGARDRANGVSGMIMGLSSSGAGFASGFALAYLGIFTVVVMSIAITILALIHLAFLTIPEDQIAHSEENPKKLDVRGTMRIVSAIPGLFALIFFTTFNNFLGGIFMALMDPYGLSLMSVQAWGALWGVLSLGFIAGGLYITRYGLGTRPLQTLFTVNIVMWVATLIFPLQPSILLLAAGLLVWTLLVPFAEATEHTIIQKVVPLERQGRVIGFAQSIENAATPITAFLIGPLTQFVFIPFMTTGAGVELIGGWFGTGDGRGMALTFIIAAALGLAVTIFAMYSRAYRRLAAEYEKPASA